MKEGTPPREQTTTKHNHTSPPSFYSNTPLQPPTIFVILTKEGTPPREQTTTKHKHILPPTFYSNFLLQPPPKIVILTKEGTPQREQTTTNHKQQTTKHTSPPTFYSNFLLQPSTPTSPQIYHPDKGRNSTTRANNHKPLTTKHNHTSPPTFYSNFLFQHSSPPPPKIVILTKEGTPPREQTTTNKTKNIPFIFLIHH
jgi:hypothetical protein